MLNSEPRLSAEGLTDARDAGVGPVVVTEDGAFLAGVWTIVAVAGQTQEHLANVMERGCLDRAVDRATIVRSAAVVTFRGLLAPIHRHDLPG